MGMGGTAAAWASHGSFQPQPQPSAQFQQPSAQFHRPQAQASEKPFLPTAAPSSLLNPHGASAPPVRQRPTGQAPSKAVGARTVYTGGTSIGMTRLPARRGPKKTASTTDPSSRRGMLLG